MTSKPNEPTVVRLRPRSTFLTRTAEQFGVSPRRYVVPVGGPRPSLVEMEEDLIRDVGQKLHPEDGE